MMKEKVQILNLKQLSHELGYSENHIYKMISLGLPYHQLSKTSRRYYVLDEVLSWLKSAGYKQISTWRK